MDVLASFFNLLYSYRVRREGIDKLWWAPITKGYSMLAPFTGFLHVMMVFIFLRRVFGEPRFLWEWLFSLRRQPQERSLPWTTLGRGITLWSIGVVCAREMGSPWTIFFFIVRLLASYGMLSSVALGCPGLCLVRLFDLFVCWWMSGRSQSTVVWCPLSFYGVFGGKETIDISRTERGHWRSLSVFFFFFWTTAFLAHLVVSLMDFFFFSPLR